MQSVSFILVYLVSLWNILLVYYFINIQAIVLIIINQVFAYGFILLHRNDRRNVRLGWTVKQLRAAPRPYPGNKVIIIIIIIIIFCPPPLWEIISYRVTPNQRSPTIIDVARNRVPIFGLELFIAYVINIIYATSRACRRLRKIRKSALLSRKRREQVRRVRKEEEPGEASLASESRAIAAIAGRVIGRKRNYGVHGATAASCGSRVITYYRRGAIVPAI